MVSSSLHCPHTSFCTWRFLASRQVQKQGGREKKCWFDSGLGSNCEFQTEQDCRCSEDIRKLITDSYLLCACIRAKGTVGQKHTRQILYTENRDITNQSCKRANITNNTRTALYLQHTDDLVLSSCSGCTQQFSLQLMSLDDWQAVSRGLFRTLLIHHTINSS